MFKTILTVIIIGGLGLGATLFMLGTMRTGKVYRTHMQRKYRSHRGRSYYGGGYRHGK